MKSEWAQFTHHIFLPSSFAWNTCIVYWAITVSYFVWIIVCIGVGSEKEEEGEEKKISALIEYKIYKYLYVRPCLSVKLFEN